MIVNVLLRDDFIVASDPGLTVAFDERLERDEGSSDEVARLLDVKVVACSDGLVEYLEL